MSQFVSKFKLSFEQAVDYLKKDLATINTGRADLSSVEGIKVNVYNSEMSIKELASISSPEARIILVEPWDKGNLKDIAAAIDKSVLDYQVKIEATAIRLIIPQMTEESRKKYAKQVSQKLEKTRIALRAIRDKAKDEINQAEKNRELTQDEKFQFLKELDEMTQGYTANVTSLAEMKTKEIFTI